METDPRGARPQKEVGMLSVCCRERLFSEGLSTAFFSKSCPQHPRRRRLQGFLPVNHGPLYLREEFKNPGEEWRRKFCGDRSRWA